jgi:hypothetical protein
MNSNLPTGRALCCSPADSIPADPNGSHRQSVSVPRHAVNRVSVNHRQHFFSMCARLDPLEFGVVPLSMRVEIFRLGASLRAGFRRICVGGRLDDPDGQSAGSGRSRRSECPEASQIAHLKRSSLRPPLCQSSCLGEVCRIGSYRPPQRHRCSNPPCS